MDNREDIKEYGFVYSPPKEGEWIWGSGLARQRFGAGVLNKGGQWEKYTPKGERQHRNLETYACTVYHSLNAWETLANYLGFKDFPRDCSERYSGVLAKIDIGGQDPHVSCEAIRNYGVIPEKVLPFSDNIYDWPQYYSPNPMDENLVKLGQSVIRKYTLGHEHIFNAFTLPKHKAQLIVAALERGPVCVSVRAWKEKDGLYYKEPNEADTHWVHITGYKEGKYFTVRDSYIPYDKKVAWDTNFQSAKVYFMKLNETGKTPFELTPWYIKFISTLKTWLGFSES